MGKRHEEVKQIQIERYQIFFVNMTNNYNYISICDNIKICLIHMANMQIFDIL